MSPLAIRPYRPADLDDVIAIFLAAIRETAARNYAPAQIDAWAQADRDGWRAARLSRPTWVAVVGGRPAGFSDLMPDGYLDMMFVHPVQQRRGVASALLRTVEQAAGDQGLARIFTDSSITARPFFERRGFQVAAQRTVEKRGQSFTNFRMSKLLTAHG